ncbi:hypothetical protein J2S17_000462 [Cytobacillus purgationiresistens]|uniref:Uncharacterized protein n=1 Tax=Cytobacillus purgationiresistens TaxID=863449 RepID=A0ABU0ADS2_9BACI|nr:hypothetical protein [Cytobacillus purgationiresistens]
MSNSSFFVTIEKAPSNFCRGLFIKFRHKRQISLHMIIVKMIVDNSRTA